MIVRSAPAPVERPEASAPATPPLVLTGMPLSGGSIVAGALVRAGLSFGDRLLPAAPRDPAGAYVDADLARFHDELIGAQAPSIGRGDAAGSPEALPTGAPEIPPGGFAAGGFPTPDFARRAAVLLGGRAEGPQPRVWREPRVSLFLPEWDRVLPRARWIFTVREPGDLVWSLLRRRGRGVGGPLGANAVGSARGAAAALRGARLWAAWHRPILDFVRGRPDRCVVVAVPGDLTLEGGVRIREVLRGWGCDVEGIDLHAAYNPHLLKTRRPRWVTAAVRLHPAAHRLAGELVAEGVAPRRGWPAPPRQPSSGEEPGRAGRRRSQADGRPAPPLPRANGNATSERPTVALVVRERFVTSETFIQAHARRLPARVLLLHGRGPSLRTKDDLRIVSVLDRLASAIAGGGAAGASAPADRAFGRWTRRNRVAAVLAEYGTVGAEIQDACRAAGVPLVVHFHGFDAYRDDVLRTHRDRYRRLFASAAALVAVSNDMVEQLVALGAPRDRVACVPCGVDVSLFTPADPAAAPPAFVSVGRFVDKKAPQCTLLAFAEVAASCPEARLVMVGDGPLLEPCRGLARALGLAGSVVFTGAQPHGRIPAILRGARGYVQHSVRPPSGDSEGTPVGVLEAGACGLAVVATRHGGIPDVVAHGETGLLVDEGDVAGMADHVLRLARLPALAAALGRAARARVCALHSEDRAIARLWEVVRGARAPGAGGNRR
ncbi:MAG TPA: glycosyltransferase [Gemmatimonadota bacterium]